MAKKEGTDAKIVKTVEKKIELTPAIRFSNMVIEKFSNEFGKIKITNFQNKLIQNYFVYIDKILKEAETKRKFSPKKKNDPEIIWKNVNMLALTQSIIAYSGIGLDPLQHANIYFVCFLNSKTKLYDVSPIVGYKGLEIKAVKYGLNPPENVIVELKYKSDRFVPIKKSINSQIENYEFEIKEPFNRNEDDIEGGFYYYEFKDNPERNKLVIIPIVDIIKRIPKHGNLSFYGGEKIIWKNGKPTEETEKVVGWRKEMLTKAIYRMAYGSITIDSKKIDDNYLRIMEQEKNLINNNDIQQEIEEKANKTTLTIEGETIKEEPETKETKKEEADSVDKEVDQVDQQETDNREDNKEKKDGKLF